LYLALVNAIYIELILNKHERINRENKNQYMKYLEETMAHFGLWKVAQAKRRKAGHKDWERHSLDAITWKNLRFGVTAFMHFACHMLDELDGKVEGLVYIPMLLSNQSALESHFSGTRAANHDLASVYSSHLTGRETRANMAALARNKMYDSNDIADGEYNGLVGTSSMKRFRDAADEKKKLWLDTFAKKCVHVSNELLQTDLFESEEMNHLAQQMNTHVPPNDFLRICVNSKTLQDWYLLSTTNGARG
jgi:hypothetical protein